jgi:AcrR family transcriptional regulator
MSPGQRRLMRASLVHFASRGYGGSNVRDIAATLEVQAASVYKHFPSKEAILAALVFLGYDHHREITVNAAMSAESLPHAQLSAFAEAHVLLHCQYSRLSLVVHHEWQNLNPESLALAELRNDQSTVVLRNILDRGQKAGIFELQDPDMAIVAVTGLGLSAARWFPYQTERSADYVAAQFAHAALRLCGVRT